MERIIKYCNFELMNTFIILLIEVTQIHSKQKQAYD